MRLMRDSEAAEIVCMDCGCVVSAKLIDRGPEWRVFGWEQRENKVRVGAPVTFTIHDKGLSTMIDWRDRDVFGKKVSSSQKSQLYRLRKWQRRIRVSNANERNLSFALSEIAKISNNLSLPKSILETASVIYRKTLKKRLIRGRTIQGISAASVYIACRQCELTRTLSDIASASNVSKKELGRSYRFLVNEINCSIPLIKPSLYVSKFSNQLQLRGKVEVIANKILAAASELKLTSGRGPKGIAAAATYIASVLVGEGIAQREISEVSKVTEVTIRNRYKEMTKLLVLEMSL
jgi:transcription initiation factor TFIIB